MCIMHKFLGIMIDAFQIKKVGFLNSFHPEIALFRNLCALYVQS